MIIGLSVVALATAVISAMAGMGGGMILIGVLFAVGLAPAMALPLHAGVQLASNGSRCVAYRHHIKWSALGLFLLGAIPTPFIVAPLVAAADPDILRLVMAIFIALGVWPAWAQWLRMDGRGGLLVAGAIAGVMGPLVGGIGVLVAPFFLARDWPRESVIATMAVGQVCGHAAKIVAFSLAGYSVLARWDLLVPMVVASIAGTLIGRRLNDYVPERWFRIVVRVILVVLALKLGFDGIRGWLA